MNLTLAQLQTELLRIYAHDLTPTNIISVDFTPNGIVFQTDTSELARQLAWASADLAEAKRNATRTKQ